MRTLNTYASCMYTSNTCIYTCTQYICTQHIQTYTCITNPPRCLLHFAASNFHAPNQKYMLHTVGALRCVVSKENESPVEKAFPSHHDVFPCNRQLDNRFQGLSRPTHVYCILNIRDKRELQHQPERNQRVMCCFKKLVTV